MAEELTGLRQDVFFDRYALKDDKGERIEDTPVEMWKRVAKAIAANETTVEKKQLWEKNFFNSLEDFKFVPAGRILTGAGSGVDLTFYNCYVIPSPDDSRGGIFESVRTMVEIMSRGGGVGVNLSSLRPRGAYVQGVNGTASGAVSFGGLYSFATGLIIQGGSRRGALMLMLNDDHPDIEEFITVKRTMGKVTNANLSIAVSDSFMEAVKNDGDWDLKYEDKVYKTVKAKELWNQICDSAHASGEPGVVFMERYNKESNTWYFEDIICVNPCGEQGLGAWNVCNLGAVNISKFVNEDGSFDREGLKTTVNTAIRFLDNVIDTTPYFFKENEKAQSDVRRVGLGTMGLADALIKSKIVYGSDEAIAWCDDIYQLIRDEAYKTSSDLAVEKGSFPQFDKEKFLEARFIKRLPSEIRDLIGTNGMRNGVLLTQAPTGTTSIVAGCSSGIEPVYDFAFKRKDRLGEHLVYHHLYENWKKANPDVAEDDKPAYFISAKQLSPLEHVRMQAIVQKYTDSSISKTVNAPNDHELEDVKKLYMEAYDLGCKGIAYYRDGSRDLSVLESLDESDTKKKSGDKAKAEAEAAAPEAAASSDGAGLAAPEPRIRPEVVPGATYKIKTGYGTMFVTINHDEVGNPFEVFATIGKAGGFFAAKSEAICRLVSLALRSGIPVETVMDQMKGIRGPMPSWGKNGQILSIPDAISQVFAMHMNSTQGQLNLQFGKGKQLDEGEKLQTADELLEEVEQVTVTETMVVDDGKGHAAVNQETTTHTSASVADAGFAPECPECGGILNMAEGCMTCHGCGYSKCA